MHRYFIHLSFDGSAYHGWQHQTNAPNVQDVLTRTLELFLSENISLVGCGRTDAGVHAREYFAHFDLSIQKSRQDLHTISYRMNRILPRDIAIRWIRPVPADLHARFSALSRTYCYYIHTARDPFLDLYSWYVHESLDVKIMNLGAELLMNHSDFTSFSKLHSSAKTNICRLTEAIWTEERHQLILTLTSDRFLRNMVRAIVGTLVDLGRGKITLNDLKKIIEARDRSKAGKSVPAHGLFLEKVTYPVEI